MTTYMSTKLSDETYLCVGPGGEQAYACVVHKCEVTLCCRDYKISLLDQFGRILRTFSVQLIKNNLYYHRSFVTDEKNVFVVTDPRLVALVHGKGDTSTFTTTKTYKGSVGTSPSSAFISKDIAIDNRGNILVAVPDDNAIHLLDNSLTFQKLLMTEEDGLHRPTSVALDGERFLYVGCENGQIYVVNYQYLLNTNRQARLKFQKLSSKDSSLDFPGHFCPKIFNEILKNPIAEN